MPRHLLDTLEPRTLFSALTPNVLPTDLPPVVCYAEPVPEAPAPTPLINPNFTLDVTPVAHLFDQDHYLAHNGDVRAAIAAGTIASAYDHFAAYGYKEFRNLSPYLNESDYLALYPDVAAAMAVDAVLTGFLHFLQYGQSEGRSPSAYFDEGRYLSLYPDVVAALNNNQFDSGFEHFLKHGQTENRDPSAAFNEHFYLQQYGDVATAVAGGVFASGFDHFSKSGRTEGRIPNLPHDGVLVANPANGLQLTLHATAHFVGPIAVLSPDTRVLPSFPKTYEIHFTLTAANNTASPITVTWPNGGYIAWALHTPTQALASGPDIVTQAVETLTLAPGESQDFTRTFTVSHPTFLPPVNLTISFFGQSTTTPLPVAIP